MNKTSLIQLGSNLPNCPECKSGNALIDRFIDGEMIWQCRDCGFEVNNDDVSRIYYPKFDQETRRFYWDEEGDRIDCGTLDAPRFDRIFKAVAEAARNEAARDLDPVEMGYVDPDEIDPAPTKSGAYWRADDVYCVCYDCERDGAFGKHLENLTGEKGFYYEFWEKLEADIGTCEVCGVKVIDGSEPKATGIRINVDNVTPAEALKEMTPFAGKLPKTLERYRSKIVDYDAYNGEYQVYLVIGWRRDDDLVHTCIGDSVAEMVDFVKSAVPCDCDNCNHYKAQAAKIKGGPSND